VIVSTTLLKDLQKRVALLEEDLRQRCDGDAQVNAPLLGQYEAAQESKRTAETFNTWREEQITQIAVAWVLACVFIRFLEDNQLLDTPFLAGPDPTRMNRARDEQELFFKQNPTASERDYLLHVFGAVGQLPGMQEFFDRRHNPLWLAGPTGDALASLLDFWRKTNPDTGALAHDFTDPGWNTRFLGDLYQDLSEFARKRYALLQTPEFVEQFILDRTLTPAIEVFGYQVVRMLDLTCGSGHFLLGGFGRLFKLWQEHEPGENPRVLAQRALDQVCGVDLNPNVVGIARFRLLLAALKACQPSPAGPPLRLKDTPDFKVHLAVGDSLLHGARFLNADSHEGIQQTFGGHELFRDELQHFYETEDRDALHRILGRRYHAVVGNPPYITVNDDALNQAYRGRFDSCHKQYSLAVPFIERFFDLALEGEAVGRRPSRVERDGGSAESEAPTRKPAGFVGMITSNSFMKKAFGRKLVESFFPKWDITHVIDTMWAYIPGHTTPTVILFGRNQEPVAPTIRVVMGIQGEPQEPVDAARGLVWTAILQQVDQPGSQGAFVSVADTRRNVLQKHPWSIGGGGAAELREVLDGVAGRFLKDLIDELGARLLTRLDEVFELPSGANARHRIPAEFRRNYALGEDVRDWNLGSSAELLFPYDSALQPTPNRNLLRVLWPWRSQLQERVAFGKSQLERGLPWFGFSMLFPKRLGKVPALVFSDLSTHNHFAIDRAATPTNSHAPVIVLAQEHLGSTQGVAGLMNSSTTCFWLRQVCLPKGGSGLDRGIQNEAWEARHEFDSGKLKLFPIPGDLPSELATSLDGLAQLLLTHTPGAVLSNAAGRGSELHEALATARHKWLGILQRMIALQEELDWECYRIYGVASDERRGASGPEALNPEIVPPLRLGERAFEIVMARKMAKGQLQTAWFERHGSTPITELPAHWPAAYRALVERRLALIGRDRNIALIEQPEYKRRWNVEPWEEQQERALRQWLLNRLEGYFFEGERMVERARDSDSLSPPRGEGQGEGSARPPEDHPSSPRPSPPVQDGGGDALSRLRASWPAGQQPALVSTNQLAEIVQADATFLKVAEVYAGAAGFSVPKLVRELVESESVPFLPFQHYKESGLRKRQDWERTWELQRKEDEFDARIEPLTKELENVVKKLAKDANGPEAPKWRALKDELGDRIQALKDEKARDVGVIPVPPKYSSADFRSSIFWRLRGKLDVPKERWVSYPGAEREGDPSPVIAWAGWNHLQQAQALAEYYINAKDTWGWPSERLHILLAGLADLLPWLRQWHNDPNPDYGMGLGDYFAAFVDDEARKQGTTVQALNRLRLGEARIQASHPFEGSAPGTKPVRRPIRREQPIQPGSPAFAASAQAYPSTAADRLVCSLALELIAWRDRIDSNDHLDALILATHADIRRVFASATNPSSLDAWVRNVKAEISVIGLEGLKWVQCLSYLEKHRKALEISRTQPERSIRAGSAFEEVRKEFAFSNAGVAPSVLAILDEMKAVRGRLDISAEQSTALRTLQELHAQNALAMEEA
jgi:hypothetical protein